MKIYKVVPSAETIVIGEKHVAQDAIVNFFDVINQECVDGWEFHSSTPVSITRKLGGLKKREEKYFAFIFSKEVDD